MAKYTDFGIQAKIALVKRDMSIPDLAKEIGVTCQYLRDIFKGARPGKKLIPIIAEKLDLEVPKEA